MKFSVSYSVNKVIMNVHTRAVLVEWRLQ